MVTDSKLRAFENQYKQAFRIKEDPPLQEKDLQRFWFEEIFKNPLRTTEGETIKIIHPGFWNHQAGPDFIKAVIELENKDHLEGDIEIHFNPHDWYNHRHHEDARYNNVILHVVWETTTSDLFPRTSINGYIRQVEFKSQLRVPLPQAQSLFRSSPQQQKNGAIARELLFTEGKSKEEIIRFIEQAGMYRYMIKSSQWQLRSHLFGWRQTVWMALAECLGYGTENKQTFRVLAQKLPIDFISSFQFPEREAILFGVAHFLPSPKIIHEAGPGNWARQLWDIWWKYRDALNNLIIPKTAWTVNGIRPMNRPEKRLGMMALLSDGQKWRKLEKFMKEGNWEEASNFLSELSHPFWDNHFSFSSVSPNKSTLLGWQRLQAFWFNAGLILSGCSDEQAELWLKSSMVQNISAPSKKILCELGLENYLEKDCPLLIHEGCLQIYQDYYQS